MDHLGRSYTQVSLGYMLGSFRVSGGHSTSSCQEGRSLLEEEREPDSPRLKLKNKYGNTQEGATGASVLTRGSHWHLNTQEGATDASVPTRGSHGCPPEGATGTWPLEGATGTSADDCRGGGGWPHYDANRWRRHVTIRGSGWLTAQGWGELTFDPS